MKRKVMLTAAGLSIGLGAAKSVVHAPILPDLLKARSLDAADLGELEKNFSILNRINNDAVQDGGKAKDDFPTANNNLLNYAAYFHIFANSASLNVHTNGNVAVGVFDGVDNFGTKIHEKTLEKDIHYIQDLSKIANSSFVDKTDTRNNKVVFGNSLKLDTLGHKLTVNGIDLDHLSLEELYQDKDDNKYIDFDIAFSFLRSQSTNLSGMESEKEQVTNTQFPDFNKRVIELKDYTPNKDNIIVVNLSSEVLKMNTPIIIDGIDKDKAGTTVIINVDTNGDNEYSMQSPIKIRYNDGTERNNHETEHFDDNHLLWNFYNSQANDKLYRGVIEMNATFQGSVLAPAATVNVHHNLDGNIVANDVNIVGGETHRWDFQDESDEVTVIPDPDPTDPENPGPKDPDPTDPEDPDPKDPDPTNPEDPDPKDPDPTDPEDPGPTDPDTPDPDDLDIDDPNLKPDTDGGAENPDPDDLDIDDPNLKPDTDGGAENPFPDLTPDNENSAGGETVTQGVSNPDNPLTTTRVETLAREVSANSSTPSSGSAVTNSASEGFLPRTGVVKSGALGLLGAALMTVIGVFGYKRK
ncbi:choice-of-anchor A family protein [Companilactobacillus zhachilii]|uniref:Choice-of-anchor A family protein n=1 Tax=Companilactobacillus zhachilii TaxID=2304606 RepID=A0A386PRV6_9LACO|nr:collagen-binding domain-containing protein [Companilactobacillus zhachilii]AYE37908.1 choice-of-anchor A family protein [Companilactobacillus zhachilii]